MIVSNESPYPQGSRFKVLVTRENVGHEIFGRTQTIELAFYQLDDHTLVYYLKRDISRTEYCICGCITLRLQSHQAAAISEPDYIMVSEPRYTILNIGIAQSYGQLSLEHLLIYIVSIKTYNQCYGALLYIDHPAISALDFFIELGFKPDKSFASTDTGKYWSNENYENKSQQSPHQLYDYRFRQGVLNPIKTFQKAYTPTGVERHPCNWFCNNRLLYGNVRAKVKKLFEFLPPERESWGACSIQ